MNLLVDLTVIFAISAVVLFIASKLKVPSIVGLLLSGFVAGPYGLGLVNATEQVEIMAEIGILLLLFTIGMEFSLEKLLKSKRIIFYGGGWQVAATVILTAVLAMIFGLNWRTALFIGFLFSMSSTAIVLHLLQEKGRMDTDHGKAALSILIFQDIAIIPMMLMVPYIAGTGDGGWAGLWDLTKSIAIVVVIIFLARRGVPAVLRHIVHTRNQELFLMSVLVICFATAFITYELGLKLALGAFLAGLVISESEFSYDALRHILPLKEIFTSIFFVSIGMLLNTQFFFSSFFIILLITGAVLVVKALIVTGVGLALKLSVRHALIVGLSICQVGEFAFILSKVGIDAGLLSVEQYQIFLSVSIFSMAVSPFIIVAAPKLATRIVIHSAVRPLLRRFNMDPVGTRIHGSSSKDHLVIIGFGVNGQLLAEIAGEKNIPFTIVELSQKVASRFLDEGEPIFSGSATDPEVLRNAAVDKARTVVIAVHDPAAAEAITIAVRKLNPHAYVIVRSQFADEIEALKKLGADEVIHERMEAARRISERTMLRF
jgi:CPA2 family monovalent cation:H+ antiporter-2